MVLVYVVVEEVLLFAVVLLPAMVEKLLFAVVRAAELSAPVGFVAY